MTRGKDHATLPNPHQGDLDGAFRTQTLRQAGVSREEWEAL
jgi:hypothetical protein